MSLAAAVLLLALQGAQAAPPATASEPRVEVRAMPLKRALPEIGRQLGVPMQASQAIGDELVLVSFTSHDAAAFRDQLAKAFAGEWRQDENGTWIFNRSTVLREQERKASHAQRLERMARQMARERKGADPNSAFDASNADGLVKDLKKFLEMPRPRDDQYDEKFYGKARDLDRRSPSNRVIRRIMDRLPIEALVPELEGTRLVYSTRPTKMQRPMPFDIMPDMRRYVQEQNVWAEAMDGSGISQDNEGPMYTSLQYRRERADKPPAVAVLIIQDRYGSRQVRVRAYDADGKQLLDENQGLNDWDQEANDTLQADMKAHPRKIKLEISPESQRFAEVFDYNQERRKAKGITVADAMPFMDVTARDPLSYGASDTVFSVARTEGRNIVARVDDTYFYLSSVGGEDPAKPGDFDATFLNYFLQTTEENGWTRLIPKDLEQSRKAMYDRADLVRALQILAPGGRMTVERQAELALVLPDSPDQKPLYRMVQLFSGNRSWGVDEFLRLYGTLTPAQRKAAQGEDGLSFGRLSDASFAILNKIAYQSDEWQLQYNPTQALRETFKDGRDPNQDFFWNGYLREPTFALPDGITRAGTIKITDETKDKVKTGSVTRRWGDQEGEIMTAEEMANNWYQTQNPRRFPWSQDEWSRRNYDQMTLVNQQAVSLEVRFDPRIVANGNMTSDVPLAGGPFTMKSLPKAFLDEFNAAIRKLDEQYKDQPLPDPSDYQRYGNRNGGGTAPP